MQEDEHKITQRRSLRGKIEKRRSMKAGALTLKRKWKSTTILPVISNKVDFVDPNISLSALYNFEVVKPVGVSTAGSSPDYVSTDAGHTPKERGKLEPVDGIYQTQHAGNTPKEQGRLVDTPKKCPITDIKPTVLLEINSKPGNLVPKDTDWFFSTLTKMKHKVIRKNKVDKRKQNMSLLCGLGLSYTGSDSPPTSLPTARPRKHADDLSQLPKGNVDLVQVLPQTSNLTDCETVLSYKGSVLDCSEIEDAPMSRKEVSDDLDEIKQKTDDEKTVVDGHVQEADTPPIVESRNAGTDEETDTNLCNVSVTGSPDSRLLSCSKQEKNNNLQNISHQPSVVSKNVTIAEFDNNLENISLQPSVVSKNVTIAEFEREINVSMETGHEVSLIRSRKRKRWHSLSAPKSKRVQSEESAQKKKLINLDRSKSVVMRMHAGHTPRPSRRPRRKSYEERLIE